MRKFQVTIRFEMNDEFAALVPERPATGDNGVGMGFVGRDLQAHHSGRSRANGIEGHLPCIQIESSNSENAVVHHGVG